MPARPRVRACRPSSTPTSRSCTRAGGRSGAVYPAEPYDLLATRRREVVGARRGRWALMLDDAAQMATFASRAAGRMLLGRDSERERAQLAAVWRVPPAEDIDSPRGRARKRRRAAGSPSSMTSSSGSVGPTACFWRCAELWPEADIFTPGLRRGAARRGVFADRNVQTSFLQRAAPDPAQLPRAAAALSGGDRELRPVRLRPRGVQLERVGARGDLRPRRGARLLLPQPVPVRVERAPQHAGRPQRPAHARGRARAVPALARVGLDRRSAGGPLRHQLARHPGAHPHLLRARVARGLPAGCASTGSRSPSRATTT